METVIPIVSMIIAGLVALAALGFAFYKSPKNDTQLVRDITALVVSAFDRGRSQLTKLKQTEIDIENMERQAPFPPPPEVDDSPLERVPGEVDIDDADSGTSA